MSSEGAMEHANPVGGAAKLAPQPDTLLPTPRWWQSLKLRFAILTVAGVLLTALGACVAFQWVADDIVTHLGTLFTEKQVLYDRERSLRPIRREMALAEKLATTPAIVAWAQAEANPQRKRRALLELEGFRQAFADKSYFFAVGSSGHYYFNNELGQYSGRELRYTLRADNPENAWFFQTLRQPQPCLLNVDHDAQIGVTKLWINCIVRAGGQPVAIVGTGIDLTTYIKDAIDAVPADVLNVFIDGSGAIQAHPDVQQIDFRSISKRQDERKTIFQLIEKKEQRERLRQDMQALMEGGDQVRTLSLDIGHRHYLAGLSYIREFGWFNVTLMGMGSLVHSAFFTPIAMVFGIALLGYLLLSSVLFKILVLDRVTRLEESARRIAGGNYQVRLRGHNGDEIGRLTSEFQHMADTVRDTTQNLEAKVRERTAQLAEAVEAKDKFFSIIAHDLRGPIGNVRSAMQEWGGAGHPARELLEAVRDSSSFAYDLLENLLIWASSQTGYRRPDPVRIPLYSELVLAISGLQRLAAEKAIAIGIDIPESLEAVGDVEMVKTIVRNLVSNAIKFSPQGTLIRVEARPSGTLVSIHVRDEGLGMPPEVVARLFKIGLPNISTSGTRRERGTGLGLILCMELAAKNRGDIQVQSVPGQGSVFTLILPAPPGATPEA